MDSHHYLTRDEALQRYNIRMIAWDMFYSACMGMSLHPGTTRDAAHPRSPAEAALIADQMLAERDQRFPPV